MNISAIDPGLFDLVMRDADFVIYYNQKPLLTQGGMEFSHRDSRILKHILLQLTLDGTIEFRTVSSQSIFSFCKDYIEQNSDPVASQFDYFIQNDPLLKVRFSKESGNRLFDLSLIADFPEESNHILNLMLMGASVIMKGFRDFFSALENFKTIEKNFAGHRDTVTKFVKDTYESLPSEKKAAVNLLSQGHNTGILLPLMMLNSNITASEYALSSIITHAGYPGSKTQENEDTLGLKDQLIPVQVDWTNPNESIKTFHEQALKTIEFLEYFENPAAKMSVISELINQGENDRLEFKSTVRWDIRQNKKNPAIEHAALKTVTAFLNSEGGDLLIGVADDGTVLGIENDNFLNDDKFLLHVWMLIKTSLGQDVSQYIRTTLEKFEGKTVCRIQCKQSPKPVFLRQSGFDEMFYIRIGPSSGNMEISEALKYISEHF